MRLPTLGGIEADRWTVAATTAGGRVAVPGSELLNDAGALEIGRLLDQTGPSRVELHVRGPLGLDLRTAFSAVPGLKVERPTEVVLPQAERGLSIRVSAAEGVRIEGRPGAEVVEVPVPIGASAAHVTVAGGVEPIGLRVAVPKLTWGLMHASGVGLLSTQPIVIDRDDLESGDARAIMVATGLPGTPVRASIATDHRPVAESDWEETGGSEGRWAAELAAFRDAVRLVSEPRIDVTLAIPSGRCHAGSIVTRVAVTNIGATFDDETRILEISFQETRPISRRVARLWSRQRPWEPAMEVPIPDDHEGVLSVVASEFVPGDYRVQITVDDPWFPASRPRRGAEGTADLSVGLPQAIQAAQQALEHGSPVQLLELAVVTGQVPEELDDTDLPALANEALSAASELFVDHRFADGRALAAVTRILFTDVGLGVQAMAKGLRAETIDPTVAAALAIGALATLDAANGVDDRDVRQMWQAAPSLAAYIDVAKALEGDPDALDRCGQFIGWRPGQPLPPPRPGLQRVYLGMPALQLRTIRDIVGLVPRQAVAADTYALANFEWLLWAAASQRVVLDWWAKFGWLATDSIDDGMANEYLAARKAEFHPDFPWRDVPQALLAAAMHIAAGTESTPEAIDAAQAGLAFAPRLVQHDLILARVLIANGSRPRGDFGAPSQSVEALD